ncbi:MAG: nitroreductase family protein [Anaerolineae bacterium]|nr:nitroreductase family protein [Anaerolineae bacterium]
MQRRAGEFYAELARRRSVRAFSPRPVPRRIIEDCLRAAGSAPSGANMQPWHFCAVSDRAVKRQIRQAAEACERAFYAGKASDEWLDALSPLGTGPQKPFLEDAPWLIAVFSQRYGIDTEGNKIQHYYVTESVGIAIGMLIAALHHAGLATLTYTPAPVTFLRDLLGRPENERPLMILVAGYPAENARVPKIEKKSLDQVVTWRESTH